MFRQRRLAQRYETRISYNNNLQKSYRDRTRQKYNADSKVPARSFAEGFSWDLDKAASQMSGDPFLAPDEAARLYLFFLPRCARFPSELVVDIMVPSPDRVDRMGVGEERENPSWSPLSSLPSSRGPGSAPDRLHLDRVH